MSDPPDVNRRTALKTITATLFGGAALAGTGPAARGAPARSVVSVTATHGHDHGHGGHDGEHGFEFSTTETTPGWTTFEFDNATEHTHFGYLSKVPPAAIDAAEAADEPLLDFYVEHVTRPFQWFMDTIDPERTPDEADLSDRYTDLSRDPPQVFPPWFQRVLPAGGPGLTSGTTRSVTTVDLAPGEYVFECYVKDADGAFHSYDGMIEHLTVAGNRSGSPPRSTLEVTVSTDGIDGPDDVGRGPHTVAVEFADQTVYDHLLGHDVHLIRFDDGTTPADLNGWTNWMDPAGLVSDGSEPGTFLGGVETILTPGLLDGSATETGYFDVTLGPGEYAWVAEVPDPAAKGLLSRFRVPEPVRPTLDHVGLAADVASHGHYAYFPLGPDSWGRARRPFDRRSGGARWAAGPAPGGAVRCLVEDVPEGGNAGFDLHLGPLGNVHEVTVDARTVSTASGSSAALFLGLYLDVDGDGDFFAWTDAGGTAEAWEGFGPDGEGAAFPAVDGPIAVDDDTEFGLFHMGADAATLGELKAGEVAGADGTLVDGSTYAALYLGVVGGATAGREEVVVDGVTVHTPDADGADPGLSAPGIPVADPGSSRNYGRTAEAAEDDLSVRAAGSAMDDRTKSLFDRLANHDPGETGDGQ